MIVRKWMALGLCVVLILASLLTLFAGCGEKEKSADDIEESRQEALKQQDEMKALADKMKAQGDTKAAGE